jgi:plasmid stabilization system protein ParE
MRIVITAQAEADLDGHFAYILERNPEAAIRVYDAIIGQIMGLSDFPSRARPGRVPGTRELVITGYPYIVVFEIASDEIVILHVNHARQQWPRDDD